MAIEFNEGHLTDLTETAQLSKANARRLDKMESAIDTLREENKALYEMSANIKTLADGVVSIKDDVEAIKNDQTEMKTEIQDIKNAPVKSKASILDNMTQTIITIIISGVAAFILGQLCPNIF